MELVRSFEVNCSLGDFIKLRGLSAGMIIHLEGGITLVVGDCAPYIRPTENDGAIGWNFKEDYCKLKVLRVDEFCIPSYSNKQREHPPVDFQDLI